jgi:hypothetical protein
MAGRAVDRSAVRPFDSSRNPRTAEPSNRRTAASCGHCARPVGPVSILSPDGIRYHPGCWEAAIVIADRASTLKAGGRE